LERSESGRGFGAEDALEARSGELDADHAFAVALGIAYVDDTAAGFEVGFGSPRSVVGKRNANFEVGTDGHIEACHEGRTAAAKIFAGSFFFEDDAAFVAASDAQRKADSNPTFRALTRN
jgi:hypothetical protein